MPSSEKKLGEGRELESRVRALLHHNKATTAKKEFSEKWEGILPSLPTRFTITLEDVETENIVRLIRGHSVDTAWEVLNGIELKLAARLDPRRPQRIAVYYQETIGARRKIIGFLPNEDSKYLRSFGATRKAYLPSFRELHNLSDESIAGTVVVVEFSRPELHICSSCGNEHFDETINCAECRASRRRLESSLEETEEKPVGVPVSGAFHKIQEKSFKKEGELDALIKNEQKKKK